MRTIGVIGCGVVGSAVAQGFKERGHKVRTYDKFKKEHGDYPEIFKSEIIFVCVPTATRANGTQDLEPLEEVLAQCKGEGYQGIICVKSTVLPGTTERLAKRFNLSKVVHNPEFLTAARPYQDFMEQTVVLIGGSNMDAVIHTADVYVDAGFDNVRIFNSATITEKAKYMRNNFLAVKVSFANEQAELCEKLGIRYETVLEAMLSVGGVERTHFAVPGPDGSRGFGGMCFPKDSKAELTFAQGLGIGMEVLEGAVLGNMERRGE